MKRMILNLSLILATIGNVGILEGKTLKECKNEQDKISGCVEKEHKEVPEIGKLLTEVPYKNGKREGIMKKYWENGNLLRKTSYKNGKKEGIEKGYHKNGNLAWETSYKNGKEEGISKWYYNNGNLGEEAPYKNGKKEGIVKRYGKSGKFRATFTYKDDEPIFGKCSNGKALTGDDVDNVVGDMVDIDTICKD